MTIKNTVHGWHGFVELCIASWLFVSPFVLGFFENTGASLSCMLIGGLIISTSLLSMSRETPRVEWATLFVSIILLASPWLLFYSHLLIAVFNVSICGVMLIIFSSLAMIKEYREIDEYKKMQEN